MHKCLTWGHHIRLFLTGLTSISSNSFTATCFLDSLLTKDKKNENKEVAVNDFLPADAAVKAIEYSM